MRTFVDVRAVVRSVAWLLLAGLVLPGPGSSGQLSLWPFTAAIALGQEAPAAVDVKAADVKAAKKRAEPRGRLPAYFGEVVSADQREKIYDLQSKYLTQIAKLQDEIAKLEETREKDVLAILTPDQLGKVKHLQDEAKAKRAATTANRKKPDTASTPASGDGVR